MSCFRIGAFSSYVVVVTLRVSKILAITALIFLWQPLPILAEELGSIEADGGEEKDSDWRLMLEEGQALLSADDEEERKKGVALLTKILRHEDLEARKASIIVLGEAKVEEAVQRISVALHKGLLGKEAVTALALIDSEAALNALDYALSHPDRGVRVKALRALAEKGPRGRVAIETMLRCLRKKSLPQLPVIEALGQLGGERAVGVLVYLLQSERDEEVLIATLQALMRLGKEARTALPVIRRTVDQSRGRLRAVAEEAEKVFEGEL